MQRRTSLLSLCGLLALAVSTAMIWASLLAPTVVQEDVPGLPVPAWQWVTVANEAPLPQYATNGSWILVAGETCGIEPGGTVVVLAEDTEGALVRYTAPRPMVGTPCPTGTEFLLVREELTLWRAAVKARTADQRMLKERLQRLRRQGADQPSGAAPQQP